MTEKQNQIPFDVRVLQFALSEVISEEDADCLARMILGWTEAANAWADAAFVQGERIALKALICFEVMRSYRKLAGQAEQAPAGIDGERRSFANICKALQKADEVLADDEAFQDLVRYSSKDFKADLLRGLEKRLESFKELGPYQEANAENQAV